MLDHAFTDGDRRGWLSRVGGKCPSLGAGGGVVAVDTRTLTVAVVLPPVWVLGLVGWGPWFTLGQEPNHVLAEGNLG